MKKIVVGVVLAGLAVSCQKIQPGGNTAVLKMENGVERYSDDVMSDEATAAMQAAEAKKSAAMASADSTATLMQPAATLQKDSTQQSQPVESTTVPATK